MKFLHLLPLLLLLATGPAPAQENRYDVLGKLLAPFTNALAHNPRGPNRALLLGGRVERLTGLPAEFVGASAEIALHAPSRLRIRAPLPGGDTVTVCRDGQQVWATPGARIRALLDLAAPGKLRDKPDPAAKLAPLQLPLADKQLVFLPALLAVKDAGDEAIDGESCRVLDLALTPELERSLKDKGWTARVWVRDDYRPAQLRLARPGWELVVKFDRVEFAPELPGETWAAPAGDEAVRLDAPRFRQVIESIVR